MFEDSYPREKAQCSVCGRETNHFLIAKRIHKGSAPHDEYCDISWCTTYKMLECCGCETNHLERIFEFSEWNPGEVEIERFPPPVSRRPPEWHGELSQEQEELFGEVYTALHSDSRRLAVMGARTLLDMFITANIGDEGNFKSKLVALEEQGFVSARNRATLEAALDVGHAAAHRGHSPDPAEVNHVIDIVENLYEGRLLEDAAESLRTTTPPRFKASEANPSNGNSGDSNRNSNYGPRT